MDKKDKTRIKELKKDKRYNEIYIEYGSDEFLKNTPSRIKNRELKELIKTGRFQDIYNKYGEANYNEVIMKEHYRELKRSKADMFTKIRARASAVWWNIKRHLKIMPAVAAMSMPLIGGIGTGMALKMSEDMTEENRVKYEAEIEAYNNKIEEYAEKINSMNLTDIQIFMKVMDDMWGSIQGYKKPEIDAHGFWELDLATEDGYGVCRNMASDIARKLNEINPEYNARTMTVEMELDGTYKMVEIERPIAEDNETVIRNEEEMLEENSENDGFDWAKISGNHLVTFVDIKEDNLIIVLDPTNPGIGIYKDGNILMLNSGRDENGRQYDAKEYFNAISRGGIDGLTFSINEYIDSFADSNLTFEEIEAKYGFEAQEIALQEVREISARANLNENEAFRNEYRVDVSQIDRQIEELDQIRQNRQRQNDIEIEEK